MIHRLPDDAVLGILSDSHGRAEITRRAVEALRAEGATMLLHLGDIGSPAVLDEQAGPGTRVVFGNCDDESALSRHAALVGVAVDHPAGLIQAGGRRVAYTHGHFPDLLERALRNGADYLLHGHTHETRDERLGRTRIVNPGALFRAARYTCALLDPRNDVLRFLEIARPQR